MISLTSLSSLQLGPYALLIGKGDSGLEISYYDPLFTFIYNVERCNILPNFQQFYPFLKVGWVILFVFLLFSHKNPQNHPGF